MTLDDLKALMLITTSGINDAMTDPKTTGYIFACLRRFVSGDFGELDDDDKAYNLRNLETGTGFVLGLYEKKHTLTNKIFIEARFSELNLHDANYNNICIMYPDER